VSTSDLITDLTAALRPVRAGAVWWRLALGVGGGCILSAGIMTVWLGLRPDLSQAVSTAAFWTKLGYTLAASICALFAVERLGRPGCDAGRAALAGMLCVAAVVLLAAMEFVPAPPADRSLLFWGGSATVCPEYILVLSLPILAGAIWALRGLAPTRLAICGAAAGLLAGCAGAAIYSFHCTETAITFLAVWYTAGMAAVGLVGTIIGERALRW
jgi:hypothetical protein